MKMTKPKDNPFQTQSGVLSKMKKLKDGHDLDVSSLGLSLPYQIWQRDRSLFGEYSYLKFEDDENGGEITTFFIHIY